MRPEIILSFFSSLLYLWTESDLIKPLPALILGVVTQNPSFILTGAGDFLLSRGHFKLSLLFFGSHHLLLLPEEHTETPWPLLLISTQLFWLPLGDDFIPILLYAWTFSYLIWNVPWTFNRLSCGVLLYLVADLFILLDLVLVELNIKYLSLILYWTSLWMIASSEPLI